MILTALLISSVLAVSSNALTCTPQGQDTLCRLEATGDIWLEGSSVRTYYNQILIVGRHPGFPLKRSLIKFEDIPSTCQNVVWARMNINYWYAHKASWQTEQEAPFIPRPIEVHQVLKSWRENEATSVNRYSGAPWSQAYLGTDDTDAKSFVDDTQTISSATSSGFIQWNITATAKNWHQGDQNHGFLLMASNEDVNGRDIRFYAREHSSNKPYVEVLCSDNNVCEGNEDLFVGCYVKCAREAVESARNSGPN